ncbi:MAG TPA: OsmC family protein [Kiritimatiellia bacterium]|nr:OsmC family protein [Kiritimatiellia bacterium]
MQTKEQNLINGVDVEALGQTIDAVKAQPEIAQFKFRARNEAVAGGLNRSEIAQFRGALQEHRVGQEPFVVHNDEPPVLLSADQAPNPVEYVIQALLGCMTTTTMYKAAGQGIAIESIRSEVEGDLDLHGMFGLDPDVRAGFQEIRARLVIKTKGPKDAIRDLHRSSPVFDTLARPVPIKVDVVFED